MAPLAKALHGGTPPRSQGRNDGGSHAGTSTIGVIPAKRGTSKINALCEVPYKVIAPPRGGRGACYRWLFFAAGPIEAATTHRFLGFEPPVDKQPMIGYGSYDAVMDTLERAVSVDGYIAGERFSAADVCVGSQIGWGLQMATIEKRPAFTACWSRLESRDARLRAEAIDDTLRADAAQ